MGKKRPFSRGLLLTILTFGIYGQYWRYKAPKEIHSQFDLIRKGRDDHVVWLVIGLVVPVVMLFYEYKMVGNLRYIRRRLGLEAGISPATFVGLRIASAGASLAIVVGLLLSEVFTSAGDPVAVLAAAVVFAVGTSLLLLGYAFKRLQDDINEVWDAWEERLEDLTAQDPGDDRGQTGTRTPAGTTFDPVVDP